jgi:glycosyltransferase involved in cell wall biosynthesis
MWAVIRREKVDLVHIHDPELLVLALLLRASGARVVFDMHENLPREVLTKPWIGRPLRRVVSTLVRWFQTFACRFIPTVFAEASYARDFPSVKGGVIVLNYPLLEALIGIARPKKSRFTVGYIGGVSCERGGDVVLEAVAELRQQGVDAAVVFVGQVHSDISKLEICTRAVAEGWATMTGRLKPEEGWRLLAECHVGVAVLRPSPNFVESYPTKLFEYMALGLPVVVSDFPLWRSVVDDAECGLPVDPRDPLAVAAALRWLCENPEKVQGMVKRGRATVVQKYSWASEFEKLKAFYAALLVR